MNAVTNSAPKGKARLYACGGASINIVSDIGAMQINPDLLADLLITQIDTSPSNLTTRSTSVENYLMTIPGKVDGGGKNRTENEALIDEHTKPILKAHPPGDANIVVSTGSGSSGSVIATKLTNELLLRGECVIVLLIGTAGSRIEANNSIDTLKNYEQIAKARNAPVVMSYLQNSPSMPREKVNDHMRSTIMYLAMLFSRRNSGLDSMDLRNWLYFTRPEVVKGLVPQLYSLTTLLREYTEEGEAKFENELDQLGNILSVATLARTGATTEMPEDFMPEYHTEGFAPDIKDSKVFATQSLNFLITDGLVEGFVANLRTFSRREKPAINTSTLLADNDEDAPSVNF
jgi:hypothetical protein